MNEAKKSQARFALRDIAEIAVGACIMAFPVAVTEEVWNLGEELPLLRVMFFAFTSLVVLGLVIFVLQHRREQATDHRVFLVRVLSTYGLTLVIAALLLFGVDRLDFMGSPAVSLKRIILVAFPASFAATAVDSFSK